MKHGQGSIKSRDGSYHFEGVFRDEKREGEGQLIIQGPSPEKYSGQFHKD